MNFKHGCVRSPRAAKAENQARVVVPDERSSELPIARRNNSFEKVNMHFSYDGFTQDGNRRCFLFRGAEERTSAAGFSIEVDLELLLKNQVPMQEAPMFCLNLLTDASPWRTRQPGSAAQLYSRRG